MSIVGTVNAGRPNTTVVAATLTRRGLSDEALDEPVVNPQVAS